MKKWALCISLFTCIQANAAVNLPNDFLRSLEGTVNVELQRDSSGGVVNACGFSFVAIGLDNTNGKSQPVRAIGSYYLRDMKGIAAFWLKLGIEDLSGADLSEAKMAKLGQIHLQDAAQNPALPTTSIPADRPGYMMYGFNINDSSLAVWDRIFKDGVLTIGFNREAGKKDIIIPIDATVTSANLRSSLIERTRSRELLSELNRCSTALIQKVSSDIKSELEAARK